MVTVENYITEVYRLRCKYGLTQDQLAVKSGIGRTTIINIESGHRKPQAKIIFNLNEYFKKLGEKDKECTEAT